MKKKKIKKIIICVIIFVILLADILSIKSFMGVKKYKTLNLIINNNNITSNLKNQIIIEDKVIYMSKNDIKNFFDLYIYEDEETNSIITTYEKKIASIGFEDTKITINGSKKEIYHSAIKKDGIVYLPISEMEDVYDIELQYNEEANVITMDSLDTEQKKALVSSNVSVKSSTKTISRVVDKIKKGSYVILISSDNKYAKIRTDNGKIGYIKKKKLVNEIVTREKMNDEKQIDGKVNLVWDYYSEYGSAPDREGTKIEGINVVSPAFFYLDENGALKDNVGEKGKAYIKWAHSNGYKVWPMFSNAVASQKSLSITSRIMNSYKLRANLIEKIVDKCVEYKLDGINIDFENMKQEDKDMFSRFIIELTPRMKEIGAVTSVDVTAPDGGETWSLCFDRHVIGKVADYIVFMAYDEYGVSSTKPGTTAGYDWVKLSLNKFLKTEEINSEKIILAIPFYTRVWTTNNNGKTTSKTIAMKDIEKVIPEGTEKKWNEDLQQNYVEYTTNDGKKQIWIEDIKSLRQKIALVKENDLAGVGSWQKGMESDDVWKMIEQGLGDAD